MLHKYIITLLILIPGLAHAHAGHGHIDSHSIWHQLMEWEHGSLMVAVLVVLFIAGVSHLMSRRKAVKVKRRTDVNHDR